MFIAATGATQVGEGFLVDAKVPPRGAVFEKHVCGGGPIGDGKRDSTFAEGLDKLADNLLFAEHLCDGAGPVSNSMSSTLSSRN